MARYAYTDNLFDFLSQRCASIGGSRPREGTLNVRASDLPPLAAAETELGAMGETDRNYLMFSLHFVSEGKPKTNVVVDGRWQHAADERAALILADRPGLLWVLEHCNDGPRHATFVEYHDEYA